MSVFPRTITDRALEHPHRYKLTDIANGQVLGTYDLEAITGAIYDPGVKVGKDYLQPIEDELGNLTKDKKTTPITMVKSIEKTGGPNFSDMLPDMQIPLVTSDFKGASLVNLADNGVDYANWKDFFNSNSSFNGINFIGTGDSSSDLPITLQANTLYTMILDFKKLDNWDLTKFMELSLVTSSSVQFTPTLGVFKFTFTTSPTPQSELRIYAFSGFKLGVADIEFDLLAILEGDQTSLDITEELAFGTNHSKVTVASIGTNQFDKNTVTRGFRIDGAGTISPSSTRGYSDFVKIDGSPLSFTKQGTWINWYDEQETWLSSTFASNQNLAENITPPSNARKVRISPLIAELDEVMIELGTTATKRVPYSKAELELPELKSVPSVADTVNMLTGEGQKNVSKEFTFDGTEGWFGYVNGQGVGANLSRIQLASFVIPNNLINANASNVDGFAVAYDGIRIYDSFSTFNEAVDYAIVTTDNLYLFAPTADLPSDDLAGFISYLGTNNLKASIQLATPIPFQIESKQFFSEPGGVMIKNGLGTLIYEAALNIAQGFETLSNSIHNVEQESDRNAEQSLGVLKGTVTAQNIAVEIPNESHSKITFETESITGGVITINNLPLYLDFQLTEQATELEEGIYSAFKRIKADGTTAFYLAPIRGKDFILSPNFYSNNPHLSNSVTLRHTVLGSGWLIAIVNRGGNGIGYKIEIDGNVFVPNVNKSKELNDREVEFYMIRFESELKLYSQSDVVMMTYALDDGSGFFKKSIPKFYRPAHSAGLTSLKQTVNGSGYVNSILASGSNFAVKIKCDDVVIIDNTDIAGGLPCMFRFNNKLEIFSETTNANVVYTLE